MNQFKAEEFQVDSLGTSTVDSPIGLTWFVEETERFLFETDPDKIKQLEAAKTPVVTIERGGPRKKIFFNPTDTKAAIITCGGLCPGINNVIASVTTELLCQYGIKSVVGYRFGYKGLISPEEPLELTLDYVSKISELGGSVLSSSRGPQDVGEMVDRLIRDKVNLLFLIGGDGTLRGGDAVYQEVKKRGLKIAVVGIPKTIDNDLNFISKSFGFETAYGKAVEAIRCAHTEAVGAPNGVGLVKVMGRHSGSIACHSTISSHLVNFCMIPEVPFKLEGEMGLLSAIKKRLKARGHAVIVVAEGAGIDLMGGGKEKDASGNIKLGDIGQFLKSIIEGFKKENLELNLKYIDPSYIIRSIPADPSDALFCNFLGQYAVHAAMAGRTGIVLGQWNSKWAHLPISLVTEKRKHVNPNGTVWRAVLESTGQNLQ